MCKYANNEYSRFTRCHEVALKGEYRIIFFYNNSSVLLCESLSVFGKINHKENKGKHKEHSPQYYRATFK